QALRERLAAAPPAFAAGDLRAMLAQFGAPATSIRGATVRDVRVGGAGVRFVLELAGGATVADPANVTPWLQALAPGAYLITYEPATGYQAQPLTPPALQLSVAADRWEPVALQPLGVAVRLRNTGREDAGRVRVEVLATAPGAPEQPAGEVWLDAMAGDPTTAHLTWSPPAAGQWTLQARVIRATGEIAAEATVALSVQEPASLTAAALFAPRVLGVHLPLLFLLVGIAAATGLLTAAAVRAGRGAGHAGGGG
ncbi:MAG: hypothetical protein ACRDI2_02185, partial [Chloroflexota bacterium]